MITWLFGILLPGGSTREIHQNNFSPKEMFCSLIESIHFLDDVLKTAPSLFRQNKEEIISFYKPPWIDPGIFRWNTNIHGGLWELGNNSTFFLSMDKIYSSLTLWYFHSFISIIVCFCCRTVRDGRRVDSWYNVRPRVCQFTVKTAIRTLLLATVPVLLPKEHPVLVPLPSKVTKLT